MDNILFNACDGDMSRRKEIGSYRIDDILLWLQHNKYKSFIERKMIEQASQGHK